MRARTDNLDVPADCTGDPLRDGDFCWIKHEGSNDWTIALLGIMSDGEMLWYPAMYDYYVAITAIGPRVIKPNGLD